MNRLYKHLGVKARAFLALSLILISTACGSSSSAPPPNGDALQFVGRSQDGSASVAFARIDSKLLAYVCNDTDLGEWFEAEESRDLRELSTESGARIVLDSADDFSSGSFFSQNGTELRFQTSVAGEGQGLFLLFGDEAVALDPANAQELSLEEIINNALVDAIQRQAGTEDIEPFRAGWIVGAGEQPQGNLTTQGKLPRALGNVLPLKKEQLAFTQGLSALRLVGGLGGSPLQQVGSVKSGNTTVTPFLLCAGSGNGECNKLLFINEMLIDIANTIGDNDILEDLIEAELNECAEEILTFCPNAS